MHKNQRGNQRLDQIGAVASGVCAVHCATSAVLPAAFGALGLAALSGHQAEWVLALLAVTVAAGALTLGWSRHRSLWAAGLLATGIVGLLASRGLEATHSHADAAGPFGTVLGVIAGVALLVGHLLNVRMPRRSRKARSVSKLMSNRRRA